ncbi:hypothetical protein DZK27_01440 [Rhodobacteraceae bacterium 63075]|nr:hypothetical protein DZK27_01440 [Rhodobacteraceae bacterium 63075]
MYPEKGLLLAPLQMECAMPRVTLTGQGAIAISDPDLLAGLTDLAIGSVDGTPVLYVTSRGGGILGRFSLGDGDDPAVLGDSWEIPDGLLDVESPEIALVNGPGGASHVLLAGLGGEDLTGRLETGSGLGDATSFDAGAFDLGQISEIAMTGSGDSAVATLQGGGVIQLDFAAGGLVSASAAIGLGDLAAQEASGITWFSAFGIPHVAVSYAGSDQIALLRDDGLGQLIHVNTVSPEDGAWVNSPGAVVSVTGADGLPYVIVAASGSSSLTVLAVEGGGLVPVDHLLDTRETRFEDADHLSVIELAGQPYVVAAGSDQGVTVLALLPGGQLMEVASLEASLDTPINGITALETVVVGDTARIFLSTDGAPYLVELTFSLDAPGVTRTGAAGDDALTGTGGDDIISGGAGADTLSGGGGHDMLVDGAGVDWLTGGSGADTFIFEADGAVDRITDFERGIDSILLRAPGILLGEGDIELLSHSWGAEIRIGSEVLWVYSSDGGALTWDDFAAGGLGLTPNISTNLDDYVFGTGNGPEGGSTLEATQLFSKPAFDVPVLNEPVIVVDDGAAQQGGGNDDALAGGSGSDQITGGVGNDTITGQGGDDVLIGGAGFDTLMGGGGNDSLSGGDHADLVYGGSGHDVITGGAGFDNLYGDGGNDSIWGGDAPDRIWGGDGDDWISAGSNYGYTVDGVFGGAGNDTIFGDAGFDHLVGGPGDDFIDGGHQADNLYGGDGADTLIGNLGFDRLFGGDGNDLLYGGPGPDSHFGQQGDDRMWGGTGNDRFFGGAGDDYIVGEDGDDTLGGNAGFDTLIGGAGDDVLYGDFNADRFVFADGHGHDTVMDFESDSIYEVLDLSGISWFTATSDVMAASEQVGADVVITTGADSSITLAGVDLADLDGTDFMF